ncbi:MAG: hypothetical protein K2Y37_07065, partial [Pirellulales bacterium]|nr:hypothetical protein [Pirellulales bacterium]
ARFAQHNWLLSLRDPDAAAPYLGHPAEQTQPHGQSTWQTLFELTHYQGGSSLAHILLSLRDPDAAAPYLGHPAVCFAQQQQGSF